MSSVPDVIISQNHLNDALSIISNGNMFAIDTEFLREKTYYPQLCLIQIAGNGIHFAIDPIAGDLDLSQLWDLLQDEAITKVFHAGRQDIEIFFHLTGKVPANIFDTQIASMVCGLGDQVGYDKLVHHFLGKTIDKSSRFTDWSKRPLSEKQISYALDDVIYLAAMYPMLADQLETKGRTGWLADENARLEDPATYQTAPDDAWKRIKVRTMRPAPFRRMMHLAAWRESEAQKRNLPRNRIMRDETILDLAGTNPGKPDDFSRIRNFPGGANGKLVAQVMKVLKSVAEMPESTLPEAKTESRTARPPVAVMDLLRVLLKHITDAEGVAPRLIASADELEQLALDDNAPIRALSGWRYDIFGKPALQLKHGRTAMAVDGRRIRLIDLES